MRQRVSAIELKKWELLEKIDPWGQARDDYRAARICQAMGGGRISEILKAFDFSEPQAESRQDDDEFYEQAKRKAK